MKDIRNFSGQLGICIPGKYHQLGHGHYLLELMHIGLENGLECGWGGRIRTSEWRDQNPLPYHLATPQELLQLNRRARHAASPLCIAAAPPRADRAKASDSYRERRIPSNAQGAAPKRPWRPPRPAWIRIRTH